MNRMTDNDRNWGPFTLARWKNVFTAEFSTGDEEDGPMQNQLLFVAFGWALRITLPNLIPCAREKVEAKSWDAETIKRLGRDYYFNTWDRRFGISLSDMGNGYDFLQVRFGRQTNDSRTDMDWCRHLPWMQWDHVRRSLYSPDGTHFYTEPRRIRGIESHREVWKEEEKCPCSYFGFEDFDGEMIVATCRIEEMEWHKGEGWFKWLRFFHKPKIRRSLDLRFNAEVGPEKGSWKGGTIGTGCEMLHFDTPETAFRRYCEKQQRARHDRKYQIRFIGPCGPPPKVEKQLA